MRLARALDDKKLDLRLRDKLVHENKLTKAQVEKYLAELPDDAANITYTEKVEQTEEASQ